jgi:hypothetical protein
MGKEEFSIEISGVHLGCKLQSGIDSSILFDRFERKMKEERGKGNLVSQSILIGSVFSQDVDGILAETFLESSMYMNATGTPVERSDGDVGRSGTEGSDETQEGFRMVQNIMERILENIRIQVKDVSIDIDFEDLFGESGLFPSIVRFHLDEFELMSVKAYSAREYIPEEWNDLLKRQESDGEHTIARVLSVRGLSIALVHPQVDFDDTIEEKEGKDFVLFKTPTSDPWKVLVNINQNTRNMVFHGEIHAILGQVFFIASPIRIRMLLLMMREVQDALRRSNWHALLPDKNEEKDAKDGREHMEESDMSLSLYSMASSENDEDDDEFMECYSDMKDIPLEQRRETKAKSGKKTSKSETDGEDDSRDVLEGDGSARAASETSPLWKIQFQEMDCKLVFLNQDEIDFPVDGMGRTDSIVPDGVMALIGWMDRVHGGLLLLEGSKNEFNVGIHSFSLRMEEGRFVVVVSFLDCMLLSFS